MRVRINQPPDVGEILLAFRSAPRFVEKCPEFSLKNILDCGDLQRDAENLARRGTRHEREVTWIHLNLYAKLGVGGAHIETVRETFDAKTRGQDPLDENQILRCNGDIEVAADQRLHVSVCIDDAESDRVNVQEREERFAKARAVIDDSGPQCRGVQATPPASPGA